ncbi:MAG: hypothetical protein H6641_26235 [Caldilineaceae bacterium]|nr:hypothetical protein [Caldilineaceae bacterium]
MSNKSNQDFLAAADRIGARLCRDALWAGGRCNWLGAAMEPVNGAWKIVQRTFGPDLYGGTSGIALFLAHLYRQSGERIYAETARGALRQAISCCDQIPAAGRISHYAGALGIGYASMQVGELFDDAALCQQGHQLVQDVLAPDAEPAQGTDVLSGIAGAIPTLLWMHVQTGQCELLARAVDFGHQLVASARRAPHGWSWNTLNLPETQRKHDLTGFSHGAAGIGWALLELYHATQDTQFHHAASQAFAYERHWFNAQQGNWPDFRGLNDGTAQPGAAPGYMAAWCHGAPGIGLSRLRGYVLLDDAELRTEAEIAIRTTSQMLDHTAASHQENYSLCHGQGGNAELLIYGSQVLNRPELFEKAAAIGRMGLTRIDAQDAPWPCGVMGAGETPGLLLGTAGIGYFYLRLYAPMETPSVLITSSN